jgi:hypothetical protein
MIMSHRAKNSLVQVPADTFGVLNVGNVRTVLPRFVRFMHHLVNQKRVQTSE